MKPVQPEEISALLDGELAPGRAEEVRRAIAEEQGLREVYQQMADMDGDLISYAAECQFNPRLSLPSDVPAFHISIWPVAFCLFAVHILAKLLPVSSGIGIQLVALALLVGWFLRLLLPRFRDDPWQIAHELRLNSVWSPPSAA